MPDLRASLSENPAVQSYLERDEPFLKTLDPEQRVAVLLPQEPALIIGAAGTGKTKVALVRLAHMLKQGISPGHVTLLMHGEDASHRALAELETCASGLIDFPFIGTFQSFLQNVLQDYGYQLGFNVLPEVFADDIERIPLLEKVIARTPLEYFSRGSTLLRALRRDESEHFSFRDVLHMMDRARDEGIGPEMYARYVQKKKREKAPSYEPLTKYFEEDFLKHRDISAIYTAFDAALRKYNIADWRTLAMRLFENLQTHHETLIQMRERYRYFIIDEFQQMGTAEIMLLRTLIGSSGSIMAMGDDDQSIGRGGRSAYGAFQHFLSIYPKARIIQLQTQHRSTCRIMYVAERLAKKNGADRFGLEKMSKNCGAEGDPVSLKIFSDRDDELLWLARRIRGWVVQNKRPFSDVAVIVRTKAQMPAVEKTLMQARIPLQHEAAGTPLFDHPEAGDFLALLKLAVHLGDDMAFSHFLKSPLGGWNVISAHTLSVIASEHRVSMFQALEILGRKLSRDSAALGEIESVRSNIKALSTYAEKQDAWACVRKAWKLFAVLRNRTNEPAHWKANSLKAISGLGHLARRFTHLYPESASLSNFLNYIALRRLLEDGESAKLSMDSGSGVRILTTQQAKGREFAVVFIPFLNEGEFPARAGERRVDLPHEICRTDVPDGDPWSQEERRNLYVAMTRAREKLYISCVDNHGKKPSIFLGDIEDEHRKGALTRSVGPELTLDLNRLFKHFNAPGLSVDTDAGAEPLPEFLRPRVSPGGLPVEKPAVRKSIFYATQLNEYLICPLRYQFAHICEIPLEEKSSGMLEKIVGKTIVEFSRQFMKGGPEEFSLLTEIFDALWGAKHFQNSLQKRYAEKRARHMLEVYFKVRPRIFQTPLLLDERYHLQIAGFGVQGKIGFVHQLNAGDRELEVVELRAKDAVLAAHPSEDLGLHLAATATSVKLGVTPGKVALYDLDSGKKISAPFDEEAKKQALVKFMDIARWIERGIFEPSGEKQQRQTGDECSCCRSCDFIDFCPV